MSVAPLVADSEYAVTDTNTPAPYKTPLPKLQLGILCAIRMMDPVTFTQIFPYVNEFLARLHLVEDHSHIGFYSGLVESTFAFFQVISIYEWAKISEKWGRRPIVVGGTFGLSVATILLGFSSSFVTILLSRALAGFFSGNAAVLHSVLGELTDATNQHKAFPVYGLFWPLGSIVGPILGGLLADPAQQYPRVFDKPFFRQLPYFLPCFVTGSIALVTAFMALLFLRETHPIKRSPRNKGVQEQRSVNIANVPPQRRLTVKELLEIPIIRALSISGASLCFTATAFDAVFVLFAYTRIEEGGLDFSTAQIGYALAIAGSSSILIQIAFLPTLLKRVDTAKLYNFCMWMWPICYLILPNLRVLVGSKYLLWTGIISLLAISRVACLAYSISMVLVKEYAPSPFALGQSNGLVMFAMAAARAVAPAFVSTTYALSLQHDILGGYFWVFIMMVIALLGASLSRSIRHPEGQIRLTEVHEHWQ